MNGIYRLLITLGIIAALALLTGCGQNSTNGATQSPSTVTPGLSSTATHKPTTTPLPTATTALLPTATAGTVTLRTNAASYHVSDTITVTLSHASNQSIHFPDHLTDCTVILLQREVNGSWEAANTCRLEIVTRLHTLNAGQSLTVQLVSPPNQWVPGLYRATLSYFTSSTTAQTAIYSAGFQVG